MNETIGKILTNMVPTLDEISENIALVHNNNIKRHTSRIKFMDEAAEKGKIIDKDLYQQSLDGIDVSQKILDRGNLTQDRLDDMGISAAKAYEANMRIARKSFNEGGELTLADKVGIKKDMARNYFIGPGVSKEARNKRMGVAAAGVVGAGIGARFLSGGNLTRNGDGQNDIAVIPFI